MMKKAAIPSLVITNLFVLKTKITYIQTKNSMKVPIVYKKENMQQKIKKTLLFFIIVVSDGPF